MKVNVVSICAPAETNEWAAFTSAVHMQRDFSWVISPSLFAAFQDSHSAWIIASFRLHNIHTLVCASRYVTWSIYFYVFGRSEEAELHLVKTSVIQKLCRCSSALTFTSLVLLWHLVPLCACVCVLTCVLTPLVLWNLNAAETFTDTKYFFLPLRPSVFIKHHLESR